MADNIYEEVENDALKEELSRAPLFGTPQKVVAELPVIDYQRSPYESVATIAKRNEVFLAAGISHDCLACHHMRQQSESYLNVERDCMEVLTVMHCIAKACIFDLLAGDDELDRLDELPDDRPHNDAYGTW